MSMHAVQHAMLTDICVFTSQDLTLQDWPKCQELALGLTSENTVGRIVIEAGQANKSLPSSRLW
jgi:hypothetical protein